MSKRATSLRAVFQQHLWPWAGVIAVVTFIVFSPTASFEFVWDDRVVFVEKEYVHEWHYVPAYFTDYRMFQGPHPEADRQYRPLLNLSYLLEYKLLGGHPALMHLFGNALHAASSAVLFLMLYQLLQLHASAKHSVHYLRVAAAVGTLSWSLHPLTTEAVAWIKGRDDLLCALFYLGGLYWLVRSSQREVKAIDIALVTGLYVLALCSKEMAYSFPAAALLLVLLPREGLTIARSLRKHLATLACLTILTLTHFAIRTTVLGKVEQVPYLTGSFSTMMATMTRAVTKYLSLVVWPWWPNWQNADYVSYPLSASWLEPAVLLSTLLIATLLVTAVVLRWRATLCSLGILFFGAALLPVFNIVPTMQVMAERFAYLPLIGWAMVLTQFFVTAGQKMQKATLACFYGGYLILLVLATEARLPVWKNELNVFKDAYVANASNWRAAANYGQSLLAAGDMQTAALVTSETLKSSPMNPQLLRLAARVRAAEKNSTAAIEALELATARVPERVVEDWILLGGRVAANGDLPSAARCFHKAADLSPTATLPWYNLTVLYAQTGNLEEAKRCLEELGRRDTGPQFEQLRAKIQELEARYK